MNSPRFSVQVDPDDLAQQDLTAVLARRTATDPATGRPQPVTGHHGAHDGRQAARGRSERDHARTAATGKGRSYAFRRS